MGQCQDAPAELEARPGLTAVLALREQRAAGAQEQVTRVLQGQSGHLDVARVASALAERTSPRLQRLDPSLGPGDAQELAAGRRREHDSVAHVGEAGGVGVSELRARDATVQADPSELGARHDDSAADGDGGGELLTCCAHVHDLPRLGVEGGELLFAQGIVVEPARLIEAAGLVSVELRQVFRHEIFESVVGSFFARAGQTFVALFEPDVQLDVIGTERVAFGSRFLLVGERQERCDVEHEVALGVDLRHLSLRLRVRARLREPARPRPDRRPRRASSGVARFPCRAGLRGPRSRPSRGGVAPRGRFLPWGRPSTAET